MINFVLVLWIITAIIIVHEKNMVRMVLWLGLSSMIAAWAFLLLGSPDVAMAEATISAFTTIFFIVCFEKYFGLRDVPDMLREEAKLKKEGIGRKVVFPFIFTGIIGALFIYFIPDNYVSTYLKHQYLERFAQDVGGYNAVTSIYLGYRVYDTLFEALMLVVAVVAVIHMSHFSEVSTAYGERSKIEKSGMALFLLRLAAPVTILFGIYLIANGFITAGGGFQGGLALSGFFICRYMIYDIYDVRIERISKMEEVIFVGITVLAVLIVFQGAMHNLPAEWIPFAQMTYLILMNALIGMKVAFGFIILFYRYVAIERK